MIKNYIFIALLSIMLYGCGGREKECVNKGLDCDCFPIKDTTIKTLPKASITAINIFLDVSGSMFGYMPKTMPSTRFQKIIPEIISKLNTDYPNIVYFFSLYDSRGLVKKENLELARSNFQNGTFIPYSDTYLPNMIDTIVSRNLKSSYVDIFISDCIYSPKVINLKQADLTITDIRDKMKATAVTYVTSMFCLKSDFRTSNLNIDSSVYYLALFGKHENLNAVESSIIKSIETYKQTYQEIHFGEKQNAPFYTVLPYTDISGNCSAEPCTSFDNAYLSIQNIDLNGADKKIYFWIGLDLTDFPNYVKTTKYLESNICLEVGDQNEKNFTIMAKEKFLANLDPNDKSLADKCTHFIKVSISALEENVSILHLSLKDIRPDWISITSHSDVLKKETIREQTYGLDNLITGFEKAYNKTDTDYFFKNLNISLIKN